MLTFKLNTLLIVCNLDPQLGEDCSGTAGRNGAPAAQIRLRPNPCRTIWTSIPLFSCFCVKTGVIALYDEVANLSSRIPAGVV